MVQGILVLTKYIGLSNCFLSTVDSFKARLLVSLALACGISITFIVVINSSW